MREEITVILETGSEIREGGFLGQPQSVRAWPAKLQEGCLADWPFEFRATVQPSFPPLLRQTSAEIERDSYLSRADPFRSTKSRIISPSRNRLSFHFFSSLSFPSFLSFN